MLFAELCSLIVLIKLSLATSADNSNINSSSKEELIKGMDKSTSSNNILLEPAQPTASEIYNSDRIRIAKELLESLPANIPLVLINLINEKLGFHDTTTYEIYDRIMDKLGLSLEDRNIIDLSDEAFIPFLLQRIQDKEGEGSSPDLDPYFWRDLKRFLFKRTIIMRRIFANDDESFNKDVESVRSILSIIHDRTHITAASFQSIPKNAFGFSSSILLIRFEAYDHPETFEKFVKQIIPTLYDSELKLKVTSKEVEVKFFNGNFNNDPLLRLLLQHYIPNSIFKEMQREKWFPLEEVIHTNDYDFTMSMSKLYSKDHGIKENELYSIERGFPFNYMSRNAIKFFLENGLRIHVNHSNNFIKFLKSLERIGLLQKVPVGNIIRFHYEGRVYTSDNFIFKKCLEIYRQKHVDSNGEHGISEEEYNKYNSLFN